MSVGGCSVVGGGVGERKCEAEAFWAYAFRECDCASIALVPTTSNINSGGRAHGSSNSFCQ
jgi:hypothetical protein